MANSAKLFAVFFFSAFFVNFSQQQTLNKRQGCDCGLVNRVTRIINGKTTDLNEYPWMIEIYKVNRNFTTNQITQKLQMCGGALISNEYMITAGHCVYGGKASDYQADLGDQDLSIENETTNQNIDIKKVIIHPDYNDTSHVNDIALLQFATPVNYAKNIQPICIPPPNLNLQDQNVVVTGWGTTAITGGFSKSLQEVALPVISNQLCKQKYAGKPVVISDSTICTQYSGNVSQDACQGDSGGPAVVLCSNRYMLAGIVSLGFGCAIAPGIYTNVSFYRQWIVANIQNYTLCGFDCYNPPPVGPDCGIPNVDNQIDIRKQKRIVGGQITPPNKYPWMAGIFIAAPVGNGAPVYTFACGGTLISQQWVITAARCIFNVAVANIQVYLGDYDQVVFDASIERGFKVDTYFINPYFNAITVINNIALIKLSTSATFTRYIYPICLPQASSVNATFAAGTTMTFIGWGSVGNNVYPLKLKEVTLTTITNNDCAFKYSSSVDSSTVCTKTTATVGVCEGDRGGPLMMYDNDGRYFEVALQSFWGSQTCPDPNQNPAGNLEIVPFLPWITNITGVQPVSPKGPLRG